MTQLRLLSTSLSRTVILGLSLLIGLVAVFTTQAYAAGANGSLGIAGASSVQEGQTLTITTTFNPSSGGTADAIGFTLRYSQDVFEYVDGSVDDNSSLFPLAATGLSVSQPNGTISQDRGASDFNGVSSSGKILSFSFRAKKTGTGTFSYSNTQVKRSGTTLDYSFGTLSVNVTAPPASAPSISGFSVSPTKIVKGNAATISWNVSNATSVIIDNGIGAVASSGKVSVTPTSTTRYTLTAKNSGGTVTQSTTLTVTAPSTTAKPTAKPTTAPAPTAQPTADLAAVSLSQSSVTYSSTSALADGSDTITVTVFLRREDGAIVKDITPVADGLRPNSDTASPFSFDDLSQSWISTITSRQSGLVTTRITAAGLLLSTQDLTFTEALDATPIPVDTTDDGSSFTRYLLIGLVILILLLLLLFFLWRRLRSHDEETYEDETGTEPAFPGDEPDTDDTSGDIVAAPVKEKSESAPEETSQTAAFDPSQALQRSQPTPPPAPTPPADDDTVQI